MKGVLSDIGRKLKRIFLGRIVVRRIYTSREGNEPEIHTHFRSVDTEPVRATPRVSSAQFVRWKESRARMAGDILGRDMADIARVRRVSIERLANVGIAKFRMRLAKRLAAKDGMWRIKRVPHTRSNRINYLKKQPKFEKTSLLALYSPLFQARVKKSVLDKSRGNLVFWYDERRAPSDEKSHLLLLRVFGGKEPLKWVWLPADKKI